MLIRIKRTEPYKSKMPFKTHQSVLVLNDTHVDTWYSKTAFNFDI